MRNITQIRLIDTVVEGVAKREVLIELEEGSPNVPYEVILTHTLREVQGILRDYFDKRMEAQLKDEHVHFTTAEGPRRTSYHVLVPK